MTFETKVDTLWQTPKRIGESPFLYFLIITDDVSNEYRYIGKARGYSRLEEFKRNMRKIHLGKPRGTTQKYRAVHFVLYQAIQNNWDVNIHVILPLNGYSYGERGSDGATR